MNGFRIGGYCDGGILIVNLGCQYSHQILVNTFLHGQGRGWGKVIKGEGYSYFS